MVPKNVMGTCGVKLVNDLFDSFAYRAKSNLKFIFKKIPVFNHTSALYFELPSKISTMILRKGKVV